MVDDIYLSPDQVNSQPLEVPSIIEHFNITVKLYKSYSAALCSNGQWSSEEKHQCVARQRNVWSKALKENENLGSSLKLNEKVMLSQDGATTVQHSTSSMSPGLDDSQGQMIAYGKWRTLTQHRIQLARLLSSYASVRLHILETLTGLVTPRDVRQLAAKHLVEMKQSVHDLSCAKQVNARGFLDGLSGLGEGVMETCANELVS